MTYAWESEIVVGLVHKKGIFYFDDGFADYDCNYGKILLYV